MTSIVCWVNERDLLPGVWAVSDSRVSGPGGVLTDNCPKLFRIDANCFQSQDLIRQYPKRVMTFGFGFSGSTLVGANVKEMLSSILGNLSECNYYDAPSFPDEKRLPGLSEIAEITRKLAERYITSVGVLHPGSAKCELVVFGFCKKESRFKVFKISNSPQTPANVTSEDLPIEGGELVVLGDNKDQIRSRTAAFRSRYEKGSWNWWRAPILTLAEILRNNEPGSIGGYLQLCSAFRQGVEHLRISASKQQLLAPFVGFDLIGEIGEIGGYFSPMPVGLTAPDSILGWPDTPPDR